MSLITRPFYCACHEAHDNATHYVVWGGTRQRPIYYPIEQYIIDNITPHIVSFGNIENGEIPIAITCGIVGCGIELKDRDNPSAGIEIYDIRNYRLELQEFKSLVRFKRTGYELNRIKA